MDSHVRSQSTSSLPSSPKKPERTSLVCSARGRSDSNRSSASNNTPGGGHPSTTKELHWQTNAFYQLMLKQKRDQEVLAAKKAAKRNMKGLESASAKSGQGRDKALRSPTAESPLTALPEVKMNEMGPPKTPRKQKSGGLTLVPEGSENAVPTARGAIEARKEKDQKLVRLLGEDPHAPSATSRVSFDEVPETRTYDPSNKTDSMGSRSPKKKFLGMSMPSFISSTRDVAEAPAPAILKPTAVAKAAEHADLGSKSAPATPGARKKKSSEHLRREKDKESKVEEAVPHFPSKVRELKNLYDKTAVTETPSKSRSLKSFFVGGAAVPDGCAEQDSPTLGREVGVLSMNRSVSDGVTKEWEKEAKERERKAEGESLARSKSMRHTTTYEESIPPTPLPKDTPPKSMPPPAIKEKEHHKSGLGIQVHVADAGEQPTRVQKVEHRFNNYLELIQSAPSMYSLHGDIQQQPGSQSAGVIGYSRNSPFNTDQSPDVYQGRWSEGQLSAWRRIHQADQPRALGGQDGDDAAGPANVYSPSVYSVAWTPQPGEQQEEAQRRQYQNPQPVFFLYPAPNNLRPARPYQPSNSESIPVVKRRTPSAESEEQLQRASHGDEARPAADRASHSISRELQNWQSARAEGAAPAARASFPDSALARFREGMRTQSMLMDPAASSVAVKMPANNEQRLGEDQLPVGSDDGSYSGAIHATATPRRQATPTNLHDPATNGHLSSSHCRNNAIDVTPKRNTSISTGNSDSSADNAHHHPSAVPTPLFNRHNFPHPPPDMPISPPPVPAFLPTPPPDFVVMPSVNDLITHFDVLHHHLQEIAHTLHQSQHATREQVANLVLRKFEDFAKSNGEQLGDLKEQLGAVGEKLAGTSGLAEELAGKVDKLGTTVQDDFAAEIKKAVESSNRGVLTKLESLTSRITEIEKKQDDFLAQAKIAPQPHSTSHVQPPQLAQYPTSLMPYASHGAANVNGAVQSIFYDAQGNAYTMAAPSHAGPASPHHHQQGPAPAPNQPFFYPVSSKQGDYANRGQETKTRNSGDHLHHHQQQQYGGAAQPGSQYGGFERRGYYHGGQEQNGAGAGAGAGGYQAQHR